MSKILETIYGLFFTSQSQRAYVVFWFLSQGISLGLPGIVRF